VYVGKRTRRGKRGRARDDQSCDRQPHPARLTASVRAPAINRRRHFE
jgi:hypothetical protein